ncbi:MAG: Gldg family protein [Acidobacteria bacterium]|nr:Gldg family protein [Acidobacteriota bacterium]
MKKIPINFRLIWSIVKRDSRIYFTNPTGYVFITLFIFLSAAAAFWQRRFFSNNLANLDQLNALFPYLLLFFIPALTMSVWSEERKQGTDELLLTLPATDGEIVLGKYLSTLGIYTVSLVLSLSHIVVLLWLGSPDLGLMLGNYLGYWLLGGALIAVGMLASLLTSNATIAFILGAVLSGLFVFIDSAASIFSPTFGHMLAPLGVDLHFSDLARGVVSASALLYFLAIAGFLLYLNVLLIGRRHWPPKADGYPMWVHHTVRSVALAVALISIGATAGWARIRLDVTAERLHSLSSETRALLSELSADRPVFIQAYISLEVPEQYVQTRTNILGILREIDAIGGARIQLLVEETEPYTALAREAREKFGITHRQLPNIGSARTGFMDVFMGIAFTCGAEEQVIPFFDRGLPAEYEITRSIRVVAKTERKRVGVVTSEAKLFGGMDFQTFQSRPQWPVVAELKKQYEVVQISPAVPITQDPDGLVVALPSSLSQEEMDNVADFIESGNPALLLIDPLPLIDIGLAPVERPGANRNPFMQQGPPPKQKGNVRAMMARFGVNWDPGRVIWDAYNPHPDLAHLPEEVVFLGSGNENPDTFNPDHRASQALQEMVLLYPGTIEPTGQPGFDFEPIMKTGRLSGGFMYHQLVRRSLFGAQLTRNLPHRADPVDYIVAAHVRGTSGDGPAVDAAGDEAADGVEAAVSTNVIVIADLDFISDQFFEIRRIGPPNLNFDNVTFFLNSIDMLLGDESFVDLRSRRVKHRTLQRVEAQTRQFIEQRTREEKEAETEAERALAEAQQRLDEKVNEVRQRPDLDEQTKQIMARNIQEVESRRFEAMKANIESEKEAKVQGSKEMMEAQIRSIQSGIRTFAVLAPPIPVFLLGVLIFIRRQRRERAGAAAVRRLRN